MVCVKGYLSKERKVTINSFLAATNRSAAFRALFHTVGHWQKCSRAQKRTAGESSAGCDQRQLVARHPCFVCIVTTRANLMCGQWVIVLVDVYIT